MEIHLANRLGVSRTPIREAIRKLELEGLVVMIPRRGAIVASITEKDLKDVLEVRRTLEIMAGEMACDRITPELLEQLKSCLLYTSSIPCRIVFSPALMASRSRNRQYRAFIQSRSSG